MKRYTHTVLYECDGCGAKQIGNDYESPEGWLARHGELCTHDYCDKCTEDGLTFGESDSSDTGKP